MQLYNKIKHVTVTTVISAVFICILLVTPKAHAEYNREQYGSCAYGRSCPTTTEPPNNRPPGTEPPSTPGEIQNPVGGGPTSRQPVSPYEKVVLSRRTVWVQKLTPTQQKIAPLILWILLIILAIILLIQSMFDRIRAKQLQLMIHKLNILIEDKKNFVRLVMHHINTPISTIKSATELLNSAKSTESKAIGLLEPAILDLTAIAHDVGADSDTEEAQAQSILRTTPEVTFLHMLSRWYFLLPVAISILFGIGTSWIIVSSGVSFSFGYWLFSVSFSIMSMVILFNALRLWRLGRDRNYQLRMIESTMKQLNENRQKTIAVLATTLQDTIYTLQHAKNAITDKKYASFIQNSIDELQILANKVSVTTRPLTKAQKFKIGTIISSAINRHKQQIEEKHLHINNSVEVPNEINLNTDEIYFIADSLIDNAVRYNHEQGTVDVTAKVLDNALEITVKDTGEGITKDTKDQLYEPFSKTEGVVTYDQKGMGLSLYASKILASRLGGNVKITSSQDHGTHATLTIPLAA